MEKWFKEICQKHSKFPPETFNPMNLFVENFDGSDGYRGLCLQSNSKEDNADNVVLLRIPRKVLLSHETLQSLLKRENVSYLRECSVYGSLTTLLCLLLFLDIETPASDDSLLDKLGIEEMRTNYGPYLKLLRETDFTDYPKYGDPFPAPIGKQLRNSMLQMQTQWKILLKHSQDLFGSLGDSNYDCDNSNDFDSKFDSHSDKISAKLEKLEISKRNFRFCWLCVNTRCVYVGPARTPSKDAIVIAPFFDMFNHSFEANVSCSFEGETFVCSSSTGICLENSKSLPSSKTLNPKMGSPSSNPSNQQVYINYGSHDNWSLLIHYGFTLPDNPYSYAALDDICVAVARKWAPSEEWWAQTLSNITLRGFAEDLCITKSDSLDPETIPWRIENFLSLALPDPSMIPLAFSVILKDAQSVFTLTLATLVPDTHLYRCWHEMLEIIEKYKK